MYVMGGVEQKKKKIVRVSAGDAHSMAIDDAGLLFAWGRNVEGQLGVGDEKSRMLPTIVPCPRMKTVAAGCIHTVAITLDGHGFSWGVDGGGRLGLIEEAGLVSTPRRCAAGDIRSRIGSSEVGRCGCRQGALGLLGRERFRLGVLRDWCITSARKHRAGQHSAGARISSGTRRPQARRSIK